MGNWFLAKWASVKAWAVRVRQKAMAVAIAVLAAIGITVLPAQDTSVALSWDNATQYEDGSALPVDEIAETRIWRASYPVGKNDGTATKTLVDSVAGTVTSYSDSPGNGDHCYHVSHVATNGNESSPSVEACKTLDNRVPGAATNVRAE